MRYLEEKQVKEITGKSFLFSERDGEPGAEAGFGVLMRLVLNAYTPRQGYALTSAGDLRSLNKLLAVFEGAPQERGHWRIEDADHVVLTRVLDWIMPVIPNANVFRAFPDIADYVSGAVKELPKVPAELAERAAQQADGVKA